MRAIIQFSHPDRKLTILKKLLDVIKGIKNLRQQILANGILLERLTSDDIKNVQRALEGVDYLRIKTEGSSIRVIIAKGELRALFELVMPGIPILRRQSAFGRIFWERGFAIEGLSSDQAEGLRDRLNTIATVTVAPDIPHTRIYTVAGHVLQEDGTPLSAMGFTVCAFDFLSPNTLVRCGGIAPLQDEGFYRIDYAWRSNGRDGPDLLVRLMDREGGTIAEARKSPAAIQEFLDITAEGLCVVKGVIRHTEGIPLPGLIVRAFDRGMRTESLLGENSTGEEGNYEITYRRHQLRAKERADLIIRVFEPEGDGTGEGEEIAFSETVFNAQLQQIIDLEVKSRKFSGPSEYERYLAALERLIEGEPTYKLTEEDLTFLSGKTGIPFEHLDYLRIDAQWSFQYAIEPGLTYGLFRQGLPTNLRNLLSQKRVHLEEALKVSSAYNIIPAGITPRIDYALEPLLSLADLSVFELERKAK
jgi:hypothetical protein